MSKRYFIAGTDTDVGKTFVAESLLLSANNAGYSTAGCKPIAAGCDENMHNPDALALMSAMSIDMSYQQVNPVVLKESIAPHIAAQHEDRNIRAAQLAVYCEGVFMHYTDLTLVEGAGGWRVPLNSRETMADLAKALQIDVILVVGMRLGCISHAILTAEAIRADGLNLRAWVANRIDPDMDCYSENVATLKNVLGAPLLAEIPWIDSSDSSQIINNYNLSLII
tara:strand:- start:137 stop:808 length:672 start_codon:yes stop_codon:yes gene_type:complete